MLAENVATLLEDFGSDLTLERPGTQTYDPATGTVANASDAALSIRGVFVNYMTSEVDGAVVQQGDRHLLVSATGSEDAPAIGDFVDAHKIVDVRAIAPSGIAVAWACQVRA